MNETIWTITPTSLPRITRHCSKCGCKSEFYCAEKFRLNSNGARLDIWLIYKCLKCDTTWKLTIKKGVRSHDLPTEIFNRLTNNDKLLAQQYAFDRSLLKQQECEIQYESVDYIVTGFETECLREQLLVHIKCLYPFELKLSTFLANMLGVSVSQIKKLAADGLITANPECNILKCKIKTHIDLQIELPAQSDFNAITHGRQACFPSDGEPVVDT